MNDARRALTAEHVAVFCDDGQKRLPIGIFERFFLSGPDVSNSREWRWYSEAVSGRDQHEVTGRAPDGTAKVVLVCPHCGRNVRRSWSAWVAALDQLERAGLSKISLAQLERYAVGSKRGAGRG